MFDLVIGIDPDSDKHGVAIYRSGALTELMAMNLVELRCWIDLQAPSTNMIFSIENVLAQNFVYSRNAHAKKSVQNNIALKVGRCQHSQTELIRELEHQGIEYVLHKPGARSWAKNKKVFEQRTGWLGRSNEDTRAAAYYGWLALQFRGRHGRKVKR